MTIANPHNPLLQDYTDEQLIHELVRRHGYTPAPTKIIRTRYHQSSIIPLGNDHVAELVLEDTALARIGLQPRSRTITQPSSTAESIKLHRFGY